MLNAQSAAIDIAQLTRIFNPTPSTTFLGGVHGDVGLYQQVVEPTAGFAEDGEVHTVPVVVIHCLETIEVNPDLPVTLSLNSFGLLRVINSGATVPAEVLAQLTGRFVRGHSHSDGSGLGLGIAAVIASGVGAQFSLVSPATGRKDGFEVQVTFAVVQFTPSSD